MTYLISTKGDINTTEAWKDWVINDFWVDMQKASQGWNKIEMPVDAFERAFKILGLKEIDENMVDVDHLTDLSFTRKAWMEYHNTQGL